MILWRAAFKNNCIECIDVIDKELYRILLCIFNFKATWLFDVRNI